MGGAISIMALWLVSAARVEGASSCPRPSEVQAQLSKLLPPSLRHPAARLERQKDGVRIELRDEQGTLLGTRILEGSGRCEDLASAAAVVIATWISGLPPSPPLPAPAPPTLRPPPPPPEPPAPSLEIAAGATGSYSDGLGLGALLTASLTPPGGSTGAQLTLAALGAHQVPLSGGVATWQRYSARLGLHRRFRPGSWKLDLQAQAVAAILAISGDEQVPEAGRTAFDPGASLGLRALSEPGLWVGAFADAFLRPQAITAPGQAQAPPLPRFELFVAAGVAWGTD